MAVSLLLMLPGTAGAHRAAIAGRLDPAFGHDGKATVPAPPASKVFHPLAFGYNYGSGRGMAVGPNGEIATVRKGLVVELTASGKPNVHFGRLGRLQLRAPEGLQFQPTAVAIDSENRLLVAGTTTQESPQSTQGPEGYPGPPPAWATVRRYRPNGKPDLTFGSGGAVNTDFGLPAPTSQPLVPGPNGVVLSPEAFQYQSQSVVVTGLALDPEDRPVITGAFANRVGACYAGLRSLTEGYVARLTAQGSPDSTFGASGVYRDSRAVQSEEPTVDPFGRILYLDRTSSLCGHGESDEAALASLDANGHPDPTFGSAGYVSLSGPASIAVDGGGRILLLESLIYSDQPSAHLLRLLPSGAADVTFGKGGVIAIPTTSRFQLQAVGVDGRARPLLAGFKGPAKHRKFLLRRFTARGKGDRSFGRNGSALTGFGRRSNSEAEEVLAIPGGRLLVGGSTSVGSSEIGVASYLNGR
ncbi:MAG TPA: hypothetical protein VJQ84_07430 [Solirubrobacterales bacterium]|nr:hypothetical protein [Solirubrobacterales bacterium]